MKAREVIAEELFWPFEGVYGDPSETANDYAARIVSQLAKAGFVILPKEPSEEMIEAALHEYATNSPYESPFGPNGSFARQYRAMISHAEGENG